MFNVQDQSVACEAFYSHVENTCMSATFQQERMLGFIKLTYPRPLLIIVPVSRQVIERSFICVLCVLLLSLYTILYFDLGSAGRGGYEPNTLEERSLYNPPFPTSSVHDILMTISQLPIFNPTSFLVLTIVCYLVGHQCNSRVYFTSDKCNVIRSWDLLHCKPLLYQLN